MPVIQWEMTIIVPASGLTSAQLVDIFPYQDDQHTYQDYYQNNSLEITGLVEDESHTETFANDKVTITFTNNGSNGLKGTGEQREVKVTLKTVCDPKWMEAAKDGTGWLQEHKNTATFTGNGHVYTDTASVYPSVTQKVEKTNKDNNKKPTGTMIVDGEELPYWTYVLKLDGLQGGMNIVDTFDSRLTYVPLVYNSANMYAENGLLKGGNMNWRDAATVGDAPNGDGDPMDRWVETTVSGNNAQFAFEGLADGNYVIVETTIPTGFNAFESKAFTISSTVTEDGITELTGADPFTTTNPGANGTVTSGTHALDSGELYGKIENDSGAELPSTGGIGTTIFYILGALLVVGCGIVLIARRRMTAK